MPENNSFFPCIYKLFPFQCRKYFLKSSWRVYIIYILHNDLQLHQLYIVFVTSSWLKSTHLPTSFYQNLYVNVWQKHFMYLQVNNSSILHTPFHVIYIFLYMICTLNSNLQLLQYVLHISFAIMITNSQN